MTVEQIASKLDAKIINMANKDREVTGGYCGDFLSFVMGKAPEGCCWFTVMTNVNVAAVAALADVSVIVICEDCECDTALALKAQLQGINIVQTKYDIFNAVLTLFK